MTHQELCNAFASQQSTLEILFNEFATEHFFIQPLPKKWSIAEHIGHLSITIDAICYGLQRQKKLPLTTPDQELTQK
jgi:hypothetical protein